MGATYIRCQALALGRELTMALTCGPPALLERVPERSSATELIVALRQVEEIATEGQLKDAAHASRAAIAAEKDAEGQGMDDLLQSQDICRRNTAVMRGVAMAMWGNPQSPDLTM